MLQSAPQLPTIPGVSGALNDVRQKIADSIKSYSTNLTSIFGDNFQGEIMTKVQDVVGKSVKAVVEDRLN